MPTATISIPPSPEHVRVVRMVATAAARRGQVPEAAVDEVRLAVGEAVARVVLRHRRAAVADEVVVTLHLDPASFDVEIADRAPADLPDDDDGLSIALTRAVAPQTSFTPEGSGQRVRLTWPLAQ